MEDMKIYLRELERYYKKLEQEEQVGKVEELKMVLKTLMDKVRYINVLDDIVHSKSREMNSLIEETLRDIDDLNQRYRIF